MNDNTESARLSRLELAVQRIEDKLSRISCEFADFKLHVEQMLEDHQSALYGDKGKAGLIGQAGTLEELRIALKGYGKEPGLISEIHSLTKKMAEWDEGRKWMNRLIVGVLVTEVVLLLLGKYK